jgi:aldehyde dehydrogenase (NAD(P)+)
MTPKRKELIAPNGRKITLETGLFIGNEWVCATQGGLIESINPA